MQLAIHLADGAALVAVEWGADPLVGWAMEVGAVDVRTGEVTEDTRTDLQRDRLEQLRFVGSSNGWTDNYGKRDARRLLDEMREAGALDREVILGYMIAGGMSRSAVAQLASLIGGPVTSPAGATGRQRVQSRDW
jgi:hypothetical protein